MEKAKKRSLNLVSDVIRGGVRGEKITPSLENFLNTPLKLVIIEILEIRPDTKKKTRFARNAGFHIFVFEDYNGLKRFSKL